MKPRTIVFFGESERGEFRKGYYCQSLPQLADTLGEPTGDRSQGLALAIRSILFQYPVLFFRVEEEGFSRQDYLFGLQQLRTEKTMPPLAAVCLPGVGDGDIIEASDQICHSYHSVLILTEKDFYDYLTF